MNVSIKSLGVVLAGLLSAGAVAAADLEVANPWVRGTVPAQKATGAFMQLTSTADTRLVSVSSPLTPMAEVHEMALDNNVMRMRQVTGGLAIPAGGTLELKPGSYHIMFMGLKRQLRQGERFPVTLRFQRAGSVTVQVSVQPVTSSGPMDSGHAGH